MKVLAIVGGRPQFIKAAVVGNELRKKHTEILVHTGQHYDYNMSGLFFRELNIPEPSYNLGISGRTHAEMTGKMLIALEDVMIKENPEWVLVYGDMNSTLAGALAAAKLHIPICHVEAGARTHCMTNPEEINRICTDHVSTLLLTSTLGAVKELENEGIAENAVFTGDPMYDAFLSYSNVIDKESIVLNGLDGRKIPVPDNFYYLTCHREENTKDESAVIEILSAMEELDYPVIYPVHPRNRTSVFNVVDKFKFTNTILIEPVGYLESLYLVNNSEKIVTDSGGLQREAFFAEKKCVTILNFVIFPEIMVGNRNTLSKPIKSEILHYLLEKQKVDSSYHPFGNGNAAIKIVNALEGHANIP